MATAGTLTVNLVARADKLIQGMNRAEQRSKRLSKSFSTLGKTIIAAFAGRAVLRSIQSFGAAFAKQEEAVTSLRAALIVTGNASEAALEGIIRKAAQLQLVTKSADEDIIAAIATLSLLAPKLLPKELERAGEAIIGIADTFLRGDIGNAALLIGKSIGSTTNALTRYTIQLDTAATQAEKLNDVVRQSEGFFEVSKARANTLGGALGQLANAWGDVKEAIAEVITEQTGFVKGLQGIAILLQGGVFKLGLQARVESVIDIGDVRQLRSTKFQLLRERAALQLRVQEAIKGKGPLGDLRLTRTIGILDAGVKRLMQALAELEGGVQSVARTLSALARARKELPTFRAALLAQLGPAVSGPSPLGTARPFGGDVQGVFGNRFGDTKGLRFLEPTRVEERLTRPAPDPFGRLMEDILKDAEQRARNIKPLKPVLKDFQTASIIAIASFGAMSQAIIRGSAQMEQAVIAAATQMAQAFVTVRNPLAGTVIGAVGGVIGAIFGGGRNEPQPVKLVSYGDRALGQLKDIQPPITLVLPRSVFGTTDPNEIEGLARQLENLAGRRVIFRFD